jgi:hypothetical protein
MDCCPVNTHGSAPGFEERGHGFDVQQPTTQTNRIRRWLSAVVEKGRQLVGSGLKRRHSAPSILPQEPSTFPCSASSSGAGSRADSTFDDDALALESNTSYSASRSDTEACPENPIDDDASAVKQHTDASYPASSTKTKIHVDTAIRNEAPALEQPRILSYAEVASKSNTRPQSSRPTRHTWKTFRLKTRAGASSL